MSAPRRKKSGRRRRTAAPVEHPVERVNPLMAFWQSFSLSWLVAVCAGLATVISLLIAFDKVHPILEPWWYSSRGWTRDYTTETTKPLRKELTDYVGTTRQFQVQQTLEMAKINLNTINADLDKAKLEAEKYPGSEAVRDALDRLTKLRATTLTRIEQHESALEKLRQGH